MQCREPLLYGSREREKVSEKINHALSHPHRDRMGTDSLALEPKRFPTYGAPHTRTRKRGVGAGRGSLTSANDFCPTRACLDLSYLSADDVELRNRVFPPCG